MTRVEQSSLDFEIEFYERLLAEKGDFVEVLLPLGEAYTKKGLYQKGLDVDLRLSRLRKDDPVVFYNLACSYALLSMVDASLETLQQSVALGYRDFEHMDLDPDLEGIRNDPRYTRLKAEYMKRGESSRQQE